MRGETIAWLGAVVGCASLILVLWGVEVPSAWPFVVLVCLGALGGAVCGAFVGWLLAVALGRW